MSSIKKLVRKKLHPHCNYEIELMFTLPLNIVLETHLHPKTTDPEGFEDMKVPPRMPRLLGMYDGPEAFPKCMPYLMGCSVDMEEEVILIRFPPPSPLTDSSGFINTQPPFQFQSTFMTSAITFSS
jgi:hypothetical protein